MLRMGPSTRKRAGEWLSVAVCCLSASSRDLARQTCAHPRNTRWSPVKPSGFGGLETVKTLSRAPVEISVIDRQNYHCFQPLLYQVATAALSPAEVAWPIRHILRQQRNATVLMAQVSGIDLGVRFV